MEIVFLPKADQDLTFWIKSGNKTILKKIAALIADISKNPKTGIGKPEQLKHELQGFWSRRINQEHRIVYEIKNNTTFEIFSLKGHY
jgi:toxin YoeB